MYEEINQPQKIKWYSGILFSVATVFIVLGVLIVIQLLKYRFPQAKAVIFDIMGILLISFLVWAILSKKASYYKYSLNDNYFCAEKYTGRRQVRGIIIAIEDIISLEPYNKSTDVRDNITDNINLNSSDVSDNIEQNNIKYKSFRYNASENDFLLTYNEKDRIKNIIISPSQKLKSLLADKMKGTE